MGNNFGDYIGSGYGDPLGGRMTPEDMRRQRELSGRQTWRDMLTEAEALQLSAEMERRAEEIVRARSSPTALALLDSQRR